MTLRRLDGAEVVWDGSVSASTEAMTLRRHRRTANLGASTGLSLHGSNDLEAESRWG